MKCPKCKYTSFDCNEKCPSCGKIFEAGKNLLITNTNINFMANPPALLDRLIESSKKKEVINMNGLKIENILNETTTDLVEEKEENIPELDLDLGLVTSDTNDGNIEMPGQEKELADDELILIDLKELVSDVPNEEPKQEKEPADLSMDLENLELEDLNSAKA